MDFTSIYLTKMHNSMHYRNFSNATAGYSIVVSMKLASMAAQDLKIIETVGDECSYSVDFKLNLNSFQHVDLTQEAEKYTPEILQAVIDEEKYLASMLKHSELKNISMHRVADLDDLLESLQDGSLFGHTVHNGYISDCICTSCGFVRRETQPGQHNFPETCPFCGAGKGSFIRRRNPGQW